MIPEAYLHSIWKSKRIPFHQINHIDGMSFEVKGVGIHNTFQSGPDFFSARIVLDGIDWSGNVELHVKSSDWFKHNHQVDPAYDNVILHVVYENDCDVTIHGRKVPTIELKQFIDWKHFEYWKSLTGSLAAIKCHKGFNSIDEVYVERMLERCLTDRLNRKSYLLRQDCLIDDPSEMLYFLIARAFGTKVNQQPFEELSHRLPLSLLKSIDKSKQVQLIQTTSGVFDMPIKSKHNAIRNSESIRSLHQPISNYLWKRKGLRPTGFPEIRIKQFASLVANFDFYLFSNSDLVIHLKQELNAAIEKAEKTTSSFGKGFKDLLIINCVVPFLWWMAELRENSSIRDLALELLMQTSPEKNSITKIWQSVGVKLKSAYDSQGYLEIYNEYCSKNKCLNCMIGQQILK